MNNIQDTFLNETRKNKVPVTFFLVNGFQIQGTIAAFDNFVVVVSSGNKQQMIFKHAISTLVPAQRIDLIQKKKESVPAAK